MLDVGQLDVPPCPISRCAPACDPQILWGCRRILALPAALVQAYGVDPCVGLRYCPSAGKWRTLGPGAMECMEESRCRGRLALENDGKRMPWISGAHIQYQHVIFAEAQFVM